MGRHVGGKHATDQGSAAREVLFDLAHHRLLALMAAGWRLSPGEPTGAPLYDDLVSRAIAASLARALPDLPAPEPVVLGRPLIAEPAAASIPDSDFGLPTGAAARPWPSWARTPWPPPVSPNTVGTGGGA